MSDTSFQAPSPEHLDGLFSQYDIEAFVAQGGMGAVYKARQRSLDRDVAIKILPREMGDNTEFRESFTTEAKAMARLSHSNLLGVYDFGDVEGMPYIVMEYIHGQSLYHSAFDRAIEPSQAVAIVKGICDGLAHAHEHGIVHRDIKPANILLTAKAEPKIGDFGLAHAADSDQPGLVMGTPGYTAPEVFEDPDQAGPLADIYSVGVVLHQLLTGIDPSGSEGPPTQATGNLRLDTIWRKATHADPGRRYATVAAMAADLEKCSAAKPAGSRPARPVPFQSPVRPVVTATGGGGAGTKLLIAGIFAAVVVLVYLILRDDEEGIAEAGGTSTPETFLPPPVSDPRPDPGPPAPADPSPTPDPDPGEIGMSADPPPTPEPDPVEISTVEEPVTPPVVVSDPEDGPELPPGDPGLRERAVGLILEARKKRDQELLRNARTFLFELEAYARTAEPDEVRLIALIKEHSGDNRVPEPDAAASFPAGIAEACRQGRAKEQSIDAVHRSELTRIRNAYVTRLEAATAESSDEDLNQRLLAQAERASDLEAWVELLAPEPGRVAKKGFHGFVSSQAFAGKWYIHAYKGIKQWVAHPDGKMTTLEAEWEGSWKILDDGTLEVKWPDKEPFTFTRDGDGWKGHNPFGGKASLSPGDW